MNFRMLVLASVAFAAACSDQADTPRPSSEAEQIKVGETKPDGGWLESDVSETGSTVDTDLRAKQRSLVELARKQRAEANEARSALTALNEQIARMDISASSEDSARLRTEKKEQTARFSEANAAYLKTQSEIEMIESQIKNGDLGRDSSNIQQMADPT